MAHSNLRLSSLLVLILSTHMTYAADHSTRYTPKSAQENAARQYKASVDKYVKSVNAEAEAMQKSRDSIDLKLKKIEQDSRDRRSTLRGMPGVQTLPNGARLWVNPNIKPEVVKKDLDVTDVSLEESFLMSEMRKFLADYDKSNVMEDVVPEGMIPLFMKMNSLRNKTKDSLLSKVMVEHAGHKISAADRVLYFRALRLVVERYQQALDKMKKEKSDITYANLQKTVFSTSDFKSNLGGNALYQKQERRLEEAKNFASRDLVKQKTYEIAVLRQGKGDKLKATIGDLSQWAEENLLSTK